MCSLLSVQRDMKLLTTEISFPSDGKNQPFLSSPLSCFPSTRYRGRVICWGSG